MYVIEMRFTAAVYMNQHGNWGDKCLARVFDDAGHAQAFLDGRRMKRGMAARSRVVPVTQEEIREMANDAADCMDVARRHGTLADVLGWRARFDQLTTLLETIA